MLSSIFALALLPLSALSLTVNNPSTTVTSGGEITITWSTTASDPSTFHIELANTVFNSQFAVANNVNASLGTLTVQLPEVVPGSGFAIQFVNVANISQVYAETSDFSIATAASTTASTTGVASTGTGISTGVSTGVTGSASASVSLSVSGSVTRTVSASTGSATSTRPASVSGSSASSSASASTTSNAASSLQIGSAGIVAAILGWVVAI
ncbi:hypothetical protein EDD18DRAFT_420184 [Armillaria luteobubalina]|uniref:Yeast cell wall synthesis Kre9/Knh1-like N-terminal domain-containing protein n=1 Tax=Armillaria luteobubalina TaxID=153913 RepID=A0AA39PZG8_9AGAR|nr:hypothetical protein EDD18DRAFT_420184 [Armillaria luteobubalina]